VDARLRAIRREVEEQQRHGRTQGPQLTEQGGLKGPDVLGAVPVRTTTETQTETRVVAEDPIANTIDSGDDDDGPLMEQSMEQWMEEQGSSGNHLELEPNVLDDMFQDALDSEHWERPARMERSKSLPPAWD